MGVQPHRVSYLIGMSPNQPYQVQSQSNSQERLHIEKHLHSKHILTTRQHLRRLFRHPFL